MRESLPVLFEAGMIAFLYASIILGQVVGWCVLFPHSEQLDEVCWQLLVPR